MLGLTFAKINAKLHYRNLWNYLRKNSKTALKYEFPFMKMSYESSLENLNEWL
jgi:hypothetical protein